MSVTTKAGTVLPFSASAGKNVQIERLEIAPNEGLACTAYPEERLYYVQSGYGALSVYDDLEKGDVYVLRPDVAFYLTPGLIHGIVNRGAAPMTIAVFRVTGGLVPEGAAEGVAKWTSIGSSAAVGCGFWFTDVFNLQENETAREGQWLQVWGVGLRRPQLITNAEVLMLGAGRSTRRHTHNESNEFFYILMGEGEFITEEETTPFKAGDAYGVPLKMVHSVRNTGDTPSLYICITAREAN